MPLLPIAVHTPPLPGCGMDPVTLVLHHTRVPLSTVEMATVPIYYPVKPQPREWAWQKQQGKKTLLSLTLVVNNCCLLISTLPICKFSDKT